MISIFMISIFLQIAIMEIFAQKVIIPFRVNEYNRIVLDYSISNKRLNLVFDTGLSYNILDQNSSKALNFARVNNDKVHTIHNINGVPVEIMHYEGPQPLKQDSVFWGSWLLTDMKITAQKLKLGDNIDGIVGYCSDDIIELDFREQKLRVWEKLPNNYTAKMLKVKLVNSNYDHYDIQRIGNYKTCIRSQFEAVDSLKLKANFLLDTGNPEFLVLEIYDSLLLKGMLEYKLKSIKTKGNQAPTTKLVIQELGIDTAFYKLETLAKCYENMDGFNPYNYKMGGLLGVKFFQKFRRVLIDRKNQLAYFEK